MQFKKGISTEKVELGSYNGELAVFKYLKTDGKYLRETEAYNLLWDCSFVPKLLAKSIDDRLIGSDMLGSLLI